MQLFWNISSQVFDILWDIENNPYIIYRKYRSSNSINTFPFSENSSDENIYDDYILPCLYNENDELVISNNLLTTDKRFYIFIRESDLRKNNIRQPSLNDKIIFPVDKNGNEIPFYFRSNIYSIKGISYIFGLWRLRLEKETI